MVLQGHTLAQTFVSGNNYDDTHPIWLVTFDQSPAFSIAYALASPENPGSLTYIDSLKMNFPTNAKVVIGKRVVE